MTYRPFFIAGDAATEPPETDDPPVECTACGETECDCGQDPLCPHGHGAMKFVGYGGYGEHRCPVCLCAFVNLSPEIKKQHDALNDPEVRRFVNADHRRRGGEG